jgi:hypothetical protein
MKGEGEVGGDRKAEEERIAELFGTTTTRRGAAWIAASPAVLSAGTLRYPLTAAGLRLGTTETGRPQLSDGTGRGP